MRSSRLALALTGLIVLVLGLSFRASNAQEFAVQNEQLLTMEAGTVFEILAVPDEADAQVSCVLTEERQFVEAGRDRIFRTRFAKTGNYILDAGVYSPTQKTGIRKTLRITVTTPTPLPTGTGALETPEPLFVETVPALQGNGLVLKEEGSIFQIKGNPAAAPFTLDLNTAVDANGDGNPANDSDGEKTFFMTDGTPLHLWMVTPVTKRSIQITSATNQKTITLYGNGESISAPGIQAEIGENGTAIFSVVFAGDKKPEAPLLYEWDFGDGTQSQLTSPEHRYGINGSYTVRVNIINLETGLSQATAETDVAISTVGVLPPETPEEEPKSSGSGIGSFLWTIIKGLFWLLLAVGIGFGVMYVISRFRKSGGLQKKLEQIESTLVPKKEGKKGETSPKSVIDVAPPMELKRTPEKEVPSSAKKEAPKPAPAPAKAEEAPAPAWLKKGLEKSAEPKKEPEAKPAPAPAPAPKPVSPPPAPALPKSSPSTQTKEETITPPWLQGIGETTSTPAAERSDLSDVPPVTPKPAPIPAAKPAPAPAPLIPPPPAPVIPPPVRSDVSNVPQAPKVETVPAPKPLPPKVAPPAPVKPESAPTAAPKPAAPVMEKKEPAPPVQPKPVTEKKEAAPPAPKEIPKAPAAIADAKAPATPAELTDEEEPIAFVRAESIEEQNGKKDA